MTPITNEDIAKVEAETAKTQEALADKPIHRLNRWLDEHNAREIWAQKIPGTKIRMSAHSVNGCLFLVQEYLTDRGFEIFIPTTKENSIDAAFAGLEAYLSDVPVPKSYQVTNEDIANIACSAFEGGRYGIAYWCDDVEVLRPSTVSQDEKDKAFRFTLSQWAVATDGAIQLREFDETTGDTIELHTVTRSMIVAGIKAAAEHTGLSLKKFVEDCDGPSADLSFQFALFGEEKYA